MNEKDLKERLDSIDNKLNNHITHIAADIAEIKTDIKWITENCRSRCNNQNKEQDGIQNTNIDWIKEIIKYIFSVLGTVAGALIIARFLR